MAFPTDKQIQNLMALWLLAVACTDDDATILAQAPAIKKLLASFGSSYDFFVAYMNDANVIAQRNQARDTIKAFKKYTPPAANAAAAPPPPTNPWGGGGTCPTTAVNIIAMMTQLT
jgi:hypothetical protein